jgi:hypothetical protein
MAGPWLLDRVFNGDERVPAALIVHVQRCPELSRTPASAKARPQRKFPLLSLPMRSSEFYPATLHSPTDSESDFRSPVLIGLYRRNDINGECYVEGKLHDATENNPQRSAPGDGAACRQHNLGARADHARP